MKASKFRLPSVALKHACFSPVFVSSSCFRNNLEHVPVLLAGDFNGCPEDAVYNHVIESGFMSSYKTVHNREPGVTHRVYNGEEILVDYIFYR